MVRIPFISIIIPCYNSNDFLEEAIKSVLSQKYKNFEIIIVDDGSVDRPTAVIDNLSDHRIKYYYQENAGPAAARNLGIKKANGDYIAFLDADDLFPPNKFEIQLNILISEPNIMFTGGRIKYISQHDLQNKFLFEDLKEQSMVNVHLGSLLCRKEIFSDDSIGLFNENMLYSEDVDWWCRVLEKKIKFKILSQITLIYRMHESNMTLKIEKNNHYFLMALKKSMERRRADNSIELNLPRLIDHSDVPEQLFRNNPGVTILLLNPSGDCSLKSAIENLRNQIYRPIDIYVMESNDLEMPVIQKDSLFNIYKLQLLNRSLLDCLNKIFEVSHNEYIAFYRPDEIWERHKIALQVNYLVNHPQLNFLFSGINFEMKPGVKNDIKLTGPELNLNTKFMSTLMFRKKGLVLSQFINDNIENKNQLNFMFDIITKEKNYAIIPRGLVRKDN